MNLMNIGDAAQAAGVTPKMIRHYESLGLIPAAERTESGYRLYSQRDLEMLRFIRQARALSFSIQQINALLSLWRNEHRESRAVKEVAQQQLAELEERQRGLDAMRATLSKMVEECAGDHRAGCAILEKLSAPSVHSHLDCANWAHSGLKQVKVGSSAPKRKQREIPAHRASPAHSGLMAWSRSFVPAQ